MRLSLYPNQIPPNPPTAVRRVEVIERKLSPQRVGMKPPTLDPMAMQI
jgi:hypothetical protein